jgi:HIV-1 Vpr-binding protein
MTGDLVLSDGILWDWRVPRRIHRFDKFTNYGGSGLFHPNGLEVIINSEIWDLRTYKLLQTVPALDRTHIMFNSTGDIFYTLPVHTSRAVALHQPTSFRTFDASDYSPIATIDLGRMIGSLATGFHERFIATVETDHSGQTRRLDNTCRIYKIGIRKSEWTADYLDEDFLDEEDDQDLDDDNDNDDEPSEPLSDIDGFATGMGRWGLHPSILSSTWTDDEGSYHDSLQSDSWDSSSSFSDEGE